MILADREGQDHLDNPDKRRYYLTAAGSTTESAAILDVCLRLKFLGPEAHEAGKAMLDRIMGMLVKLAKSLGE